MTKFNYTSPDDQAAIQTLKADNNWKQEKPKPANSVPALKTRVDTLAELVEAQNQEIAILRAEIATLKGQN